MACYGYARVSSIDQDYALQEKALRAAGCEVVRAEKASGTTRQGRSVPFIDYYLNYWQLWQRIKILPKVCAIKYEK